MTSCKPVGSDRHNIPQTLCAPQNHASGASGGFEARASMIDLACLGQRSRTVGQLQRDERHVSLLNRRSFRLVQSLLQEFDGPVALRLIQTHRGDQGRLGPGAELAQSDRVPRGLVQEAEADLPVAEPGQLPEGFSFQGPRACSCHRHRDRAAWRDPGRGGLPYSSRR